jgi:hypothetical protein
MLHRDRVVSALAARREDFTRDQTLREDQIRQYLGLLDEFGGCALAETTERLTGLDAPGAIPTEELRRGLVHRFGHVWQNAQEARYWAMNVLENVTTVAVDGSQLIPSKEYGIPIGLVQVAWFVNHHDPAKPYTKDAVVEVLTGTQLANHDEMRTLEDRLFHGEPVNQRRFALEVEKIVESLGDLSPEKPGLVLFDGSLVASFASQMRIESRDAYVRPLVTALHASTRLRAPLAGYIDTTYSRDVVRMLDSLEANGADAEEGRLVFDAELFSSRLGLFDRTCAFVCARGDILERYIEPDTGSDYSDQVCFTYLQAGATRPPCRIEFPRWIVNENKVDAMMDIIRAEIIVGSGYPYAMEAADAAAVLTTKDRMRFYRLFQDFAGADGLAMAATAKMSSKHRRR